MLSVTIHWDLTTARVKMDFKEMELTAQVTCHLIFSPSEAEITQLNLYALASLVLDIDECAERTHDCDVNAECNNTLGSYNCTCKDGFQGNGSNCTGNMSSYFLSIIERG